jgi:hypothetical protein
MQVALKKSAVEVVPNIEETVRELARLKEESAKLEALMKRLRNVVEVALAGEPDRRAEIAGFVCSVSDVERDNFNLKKALEKLDGRVLRPFITTSKYTQLRIVPAKGDE